MSLFLDASALVAMLAFEPGFEALVLRADQDGNLLTSAIARWEASRALARLWNDDAGRAEKELGDYLATYGVATVPIGEAEVSLALEAHRKYGKGNHDARLNMGDCFAYACAKAHGAKLLYKGNDFALTDLA